MAPLKSISRIISTVAAWCSRLQLKMRNFQKISSNPGLKNLDEIHAPDERNFVYVRQDPDTGEGVPLTVDDLHAAIDTVELTKNTPLEIVNHFDVARNLCLYGWHIYEFAMPAELYGHITVEFALRKRFEAAGEPTKKDGLRILIVKATKRGWLKDGGFSHLKFEGEEDPLGHRSEFMKREQYSREGTEYCRNAFAQAGSSLRNDLGHGSTRLYSPLDAVFSLRICADAINQLFPD